MFSWNPYGWTLHPLAFTHHDFRAWLELTGRDRESTANILVTAQNAGAECVTLPNNRAKPALYSVGGIYYEVAQ